MSGVTSASRTEQLDALRRRTLHEIDHLERLLTTEPTVVNHSRLQRLRDLRDRLNDELGIKTSKPRPRPPAQHKASQLLEALGVTANDVRTWASRQGIPVGVRGRLGYPLVEAYAEAHGRA